MRDLSEDEQANWVGMYPNWLQSRFLATLGMTGKRIPKGKCCRRFVHLASDEAV